MKSGGANTETHRTWCIKNDNGSKISYVLLICLLSFPDNSHVSNLPDLNSLPENIIPGTSVGIKMTWRCIKIDRNVVVSGSEGHGENNATDLNSTPPPKTKRKKHRPKVVREGKPVRAPKAATPKSADGNEPAPRKRKYTQKKGVDAQATPATNVVENADNSPQTNNKRVRRSLKFDEPRSQEVVGNKVTGTEIRGAEKTVHGLNVSPDQFGSQNVTFPQYPHQSQNLQHEAMERRKTGFTGMTNGMASSIDNGNNINRLVRTINDHGRKRGSYHVSDSLNESCTDLHKRRRTENALNGYSSRISTQNGSDMESTFADIRRIMAFQNMQSSKNMMANQMTSGVQASNTATCLNVSNHRLY